MGSLGHLTRRFIGSLSPRQLDPSDEAWASRLLTGPEHVLWGSMSRADRKHAAGVARAAQGRLGPDAPEVWTVAALLHDVGKSVSGLGTWSRVLATVVERAGRRQWLAAGPAGGYRHRLSDYLRHDRLGADRLAAIGSDPRVVAWTAEHHRPDHSWSVPADVGRILREVDDD